ncbi:MAG TPA: dTDP-4-dehydrorhamnose reductase [Candidatus Limnocylindrales bacterium]|nr:dTDP-4-dehydrorhamnose reductase [Candidatus Limnocylindrales bacterium]
MRIYLTGADGLLGTALTEALRTHPTTSRWVLHGVSRHDFDIANEAAVTRSVNGFAPDIVVHAAANAVVDDCETAPAEALRVNIAGTRNMARVCRRVGAKLVYISSDYVFDGGDTPPGGYREDDLPNPLSVYGLTKLAGERIAGAVPDHLIIRTSWLFGGSDERVDIVLGTLRRAQLGERTTLIADQYSRPTYLPDLAAAMVFLLSRPEPVTGVLHVCGAGSASWHTVLTYALASAPGRLLEPVALDAFPFVGRRPRDSTLNTDRLRGLGWEMPHWQDGIRRFRRQLAGSEVAVP